MASLTKGRLDAIIEALNSRLAGEINAEFDEGHLKQKDYEAALTWAREKRDSKDRPTPSRAQAKP